MKICLLMLTSLNLFTHTQCSERPATSSLSTGNLEEETQLLADQSIQKIFNEFMNLKDEFFTYFLYEQDSIPKNSIYDKDIKSIFDQIHKLCLSSKNNPIVKMVESYLSSIENLDAKNARPSLSIKELDRIFRKNFGLYLLTINSLAKKLYKKAIFTENEKKKIFEDFNITEVTKSDLEGSDTNAIIAKIYEYRLDNLKDIFFLLHLKNLFVASPDKDLSNANTVLNLIIQELIFLDHKFSKIDEPNLKKLKFSKMSSISEVFHSHQVINYSLLCACYFRCISDKIHLQNEPIREQLRNLFDKAKIPDYIHQLDDSQIKFYVQILAIDIMNNTKIYEFLYNQKPEQPGMDTEPHESLHNQELEQFRVVQEPEDVQIDQELEQIAIYPGSEQPEKDQESLEFKKLRKDVLKYFDYLEFVSLEPSEKEKKPIQNLFFKFDDAINEIIDILEPSVSKNDFQISFAKKIQQVSVLSENQSKSLAEELLRTLPDNLEKYLVFDLKSLLQDDCFKINAEQAKGIVEQTKQKFEQAKQKLAQAKLAKNKAENKIERAKSEIKQAESAIYQFRRRTRQSSSRAAQANFNKDKAESKKTKAEIEIKQAESEIKQAEIEIEQTKSFMQQITSRAKQSESEVEQSIQIVLEPKITELKNNRYTSIQQLKEKREQQDRDLDAMNDLDLQDLKYLKKQARKALEYEKKLKEKYKKNLQAAADVLVYILFFSPPQAQTIYLSTTYPYDGLIEYLEESLERFEILQIFQEKIVVGCDLKENSDSQDDDMEIDVRQI